jgi:hypothetical protein
MAFQYCQVIFGIAFGLAAGGGLSSQEERRSVLVQAEGYAPPRACRYARTLERELEPKLANGAT